MPGACSESLHHHIPESTTVAVCNATVVAVTYTITPISVEVDCTSVGPYRIEELAAVTGTTVRTVQSYRTRGLLPPPERKGRVALYSEIHVERLRLIADLIGRGYSLNAVDELLGGFGKGHGIEHILGFADTAGSDEERSTITGSEVVSRFGDDNALDDLLRLGLIASVANAPDGEAVDPLDRTYAVVRPEALAVGEALIAAGVPRDRVIKAAESLSRDATAIARDFVRLVVDSVLTDEALKSDENLTRATDTVSRLTPFAERVVAEYVTAALHDEITTEIQRHLDNLLHHRSAI